MEKPTKEEIEERKKYGEDPMLDLKPKLRETADDGVNYPLQPVKPKDNGVF